MKFKGDSGRTWSYDPKQQVGVTGGFGSVYRGTGEDGESVAVKVIKSTALGGGNLPERLQRREVEVIAKLRDASAPNLLCYLDVGQQAKNILVVMELADQSLSAYAPVAEDEATKILTEIATGLYELHQLGIIHRDLKPANVLLVGTAWKLADFGIAHDQEVGTQTYTFQGAGTLAYMAPELFTLQSATVKTDLYALGCLAFELLTGHPPFAGPGLAEYRVQHESQPPPALNLASNSLSDLVLRLLQKDPATRPQDARAVLERLEKIAAPLTEVQEKLMQLAKENATLRAHHDSSIAAERAESQRRLDLRAQALSDFETLLADGLDQIRAVVPEAELVGSNGRFVIKGPDATLALEIWSSDDLGASDQDSIIFAGEVSGTNWRIQGAERVANVVAEVSDGRVAWFVYRFMRSAIVAQYSLGPMDRQHGFDQSTFRKERIYMVGGGMHIWTKSVSELDGEVIAQLFSRAMELGLG